MSVAPLRDPHVARWYAALADRVQPLLDACATPQVLLAPWEVQDALDAIDAGRVQVAWITGNVGRRSCFRLEAVPTAAGDKALDATIVAVNHAVKLWARQLGYPQVGDWELTTLADWRGWLAPLLVDAI